MAVASLVAFPSNECHWMLLMISKPWFRYWLGAIRARFLSLARSKLRLCSANHRPGYWSNLPCDWQSTAWAYSDQETKWAQVITIHDINYAGHFPWAKISTTCAISMFKNDRKYKYEKWYKIQAHFYVSEIKLSTPRVSSLIRDVVHGTRWPELTRLIHQSTLEGEQTGPQSKSRQTKTKPALRLVALNKIHVNTLRPKLNGCHLADDIFKCICMNENCWILIQMSLEFAPKGSTDNTLDKLT